MFFLGPTGSGKSSLINLLFNSSVMKTDPGSESVTRHVYFIQGKADVAQFPRSLTSDLRQLLLGGNRTLEQANTRSINIIDTVGFCDTVFTIKETYDLIKHRLKTDLLYIDKVVIVCSDRVQNTHTEAIKQFMNWLKYNEYKENFAFIYNKSDRIETEAERNQSLLTMCRVLGVDTSRHVVNIRTADGLTRSVNTCLHLGFPPNSSVEMVTSELNQLLGAVSVLPNPNRRIYLHESSCTIL